MLVSSMPESPIAPIVKPDIFDYAGPVLEDIFAAYSSRDRDDFELQMMPTVLESCVYVSLTY